MDRRWRFGEWETVMWNSFDVFATGGMVAGTTTMMSGDKEIHTYIARPDGDGPFPGIVLLHHAPGWDEFQREMARRFAFHGFVTVLPNLYEAAGGGTPDEAAAKIRADGGVADDSV